MFDTPAWIDYAPDADSGKGNKREKRNAADARTLRLDKVNAALREAMKTNPLGGTAIGSMVDFTAHRDYLACTSATYK